MPQCKEKQTISLKNFHQKFPNEKMARAYLEGVRWNSKPHCAHCGANDISIVKNEKPVPYRCRKCHKRFSVKTGTLLANSRLPLRSWLLAIHLLTTSRQGISSSQLARALGCAQKTARRCEHRIREAYKSGELMGDSAAVEIDEGYIGGKGHNMPPRVVRARRAV